MSAWVPIAERLPERWTYVALAHTDGSRAVGRLMTGVASSNWVVGGYVQDLETWTHWFLLPPLAEAIADLVEPQP